MKTNQNIKELTDSSGSKSNNYPPLIQKMTKPIGYVNLGNGKWNQNQMDELVTLIPQWMVTRTLFLGQNNKSEILTRIKRIGFPHLLKINLSGNGICSIECIHSIQLPLLQDFNIQSNCVHSLNSFRKINTTSLTTIEVTNNPIINYFRINQVTTSQLKWLGLDSLSSSSCTQTNWMAKLQAKNLRSLHLQNKNTIKRDKIKQILRNRYKKLQS